MVEIIYLAFDKWFLRCVFCLCLCKVITFKLEPGKLFGFFILENTMFWVCFGKNRKPIFVKAKQLSGAVKK